MRVLSLSFILLLGSCKFVKTNSDDDKEYANSIAEYSKTVEILSYKNSLDFMLTNAIDQLDESAIDIGNNIFVVLKTIRDTQYVSILSNDKKGDCQMISAPDQKLVESTIFKFKVLSKYNDFYDAFRSKVLTKIGVDPAIKKIEISGYGTGGAVAILAGLEISNYFSGSLKVISVATPNFANKDMFYNERFRQIKPVILKLKSDKLSIFKGNADFIPYYRLSQTDAAINFVTESDFDDQKLSCLGDITSNHMPVEYQRAINFSSWVANLANKKDNPVKKQQLQNSKENDSEKEPETEVKETKEVKESTEVK